MVEIIRLNSGGSSVGDVIEEQQHRLRKIQPTGLNFPNEWETNQQLKRKPSLLTYRGVHQFQYSKKFLMTI